jgi:PEP-CTERM motif
MSVSAGQAMKFKHIFGVSLAVLAAVATGVLIGNLAKPKTSNQALAQEISLGAVLADGQTSFDGAAGKSIIVLSANNVGSYADGDMTPIGASSHKLAAESEKLAVAALTSPGYLPASVPEPAVWALMLLGAGSIGGALRSRRRTAPAIN